MLDFSVQLSQERNSFTTIDQLLPKKLISSLHGLLAKEKS